MRFGDHTLSHRFWLGISGQEQRRRSRTLGVVMLAVLGAAALIGIVALIVLSILLPILQLDTLATGG